MNDIITLKDQLSKIFFEQPNLYDYKSNQDRLNELQAQIKILEEKLEIDNNYQSEFSNEVLSEYNKQISNAEQSIVDLKNRINENNELIKAADEEIIDLNNQINNINILILAKIKKQREETDINIKSSLQTEIDGLNEEKAQKETEIEILGADKDYFQNDLISLKETLNSQEKELEEIKEKKTKIELEIKNQLKVKDEKLLGSLKVEYDSLAKLFDDLYKITDLLVLVDKLDAGEKVDANELENVMNNLKNLHFLNTANLDLDKIEKSDLKELNTVERTIKIIKEKEEKISSLEKKVLDLNNYKEDEKYNKRKSKYEDLKNNALEYINRIENQIVQFEKTEENIKANLVNQKDINEQIGELGRKLRAGEMSGEEFDKEVKGYRDTLDFLKKQENDYRKDYSTKQLSELKSQKQKIQNRLNMLEEAIIKISGMKNLEYNKFKLYTDQEEIAKLKSEIKSLNSIIDISSKVDNILKESDSIISKSNAILNKNEVKNNNQSQRLESESNQNLDSTSSTKYFDATKLDLSNPDNIQKVDEYMKLGYDIITDLEDERLKNSNVVSSTLNNSENALNINSPLSDNNVSQVNEENNIYVQPDPNKASIPYNVTPGNNSTLQNITAVKKSSKFAEIKKKIKAKLPKIISLVLCGVASISAVMSCTKLDYDKVEQNINDNIESEVVIQDATLPVDEAVDNLYTSLFDRAVSSNAVVEDNSVKDNNDSISENTIEITEGKHIQIGDSIKFTGDKIYLTSKEANKEENGLMPYFSNENERTISAIQYVSPDGNDYVTITEKNKDKGLELSRLGYQVESVCLKEGATTYEGWINLKDMEVTNGKVRH